MKNLKTIRYSETDLLAFKTIIDAKLAKTQKQLDSLEAQLTEASANKSAQSDWVDDSSNSANLQLLDTMAHRLRKHHRDLKNALLRIQNKSYGICAVTGKLIDKKRLMAVPTTTKSVAVKTALKKNPFRKNSRPNVIAKTTTPQIISRVISKNDGAKKDTPKANRQDSWIETDNLLENVEALDLNEEMED